MEPGKGMESESKNIPEGGINEKGGGNPGFDLLSCLRHIWLKNPIKFAVYSGFSFLILIVIISLLLEYSYTPKMCILCHEMKSSHDTWKDSFHGPIKGSIEGCLGCHIAPGFGNKIKAKLGGLVFLWEHMIGSFDADIKAELPVYCVRSGCHTNSWDMDRGSRVRVNHALHISKGYGCVVCHDRIAHGSDPEGKNLPGMKDFCFPCHNDEIASRTNCQFCHIYQEAILNGNGGGGIPEGEISEHKVVNLNCINCHTEGCNPKPVEVCINCHSESYKTKYETEKRWVEESLKLLKEGIPNLEKGIKEAENMGQNITQLNGIYNLVKGVYTFIIADASKGFHNAPYTRFLLENALNRLNYSYLLIEQGKRRLF